MRVSASRPVFLPCHPRNTEIVYLVRKRNHIWKYQNQIVEFFASIKNIYLLLNFSNNKLLTIYFMQNYKPIIRIQKMRARVISGGALASPHPCSYLVTKNTCCFRKINYIWKYIHRLMLLFIIISFFLFKNPLESGYNEPDYNYPPVITN